MLLVDAAGKEVPAVDNAGVISNLPARSGFVVLLKEGYLTLPSLLAMKDSERMRKEILAVVKEESPSPETVRRCVSMVVDSGAIEKAKGMGEHYAMEALQHIGPLPDSVYSRSLRDLVGKVLNRDS
jgi:geranylgeranyl pyrophosphate synthase